MSTAIEYDLALRANRGDTYIGALLMPSARNETVERALERLRAADVPEFDVIAITGVSGILGALLAFALDKPLIVVRKAPDVDCSHSSVVVEGPSTPCRVLMVDDFVRSGETLDRMKRLLIAERHTVVGVLLYRDHPQNPNICGYYAEGGRAMVPTVLRLGTIWVGCGFPDNATLEASYDRVSKAPEVSNL